MNFTRIALSAASALALAASLAVPAQAQEASADGAGAQDSQQIVVTGRPAIGTPDWNNTYGDQLHVYVDSSNNECSAGELAVVTNTGTGAGRSILPFYIVVF